IGTSADGTKAVPNAYGIAMGNGVHNVTIGGQDTNAPGQPLAGAGNLISGSLFDGLRNWDTDSSSIQGNYIGTDLTGSYAIGNQGFGIYAAHSTSANVTIGGTTSGTGNLISGNQRAGIYMESTGANIKVQGNYIGTNAAGTSVIGTDNQPL